MTDTFFERPILNSPYARPTRHWELEGGQPTQRIIESRRPASFITPVPKSKRQRGVEKSQLDIVVDEGKGLSDQAQQYDPYSIINEVRGLVEAWRGKTDPREWMVTPETARLLQHWRHHRFAGIRPFFCQVEAAETAIWLTEVAQHTPAGKKLRKHLELANKEANPELFRIALKLATGAGKTTVMAMLIAWQTVNAVRRPGSKYFTRGFLICTPGITIRDRLRVLLPNDPDNYYRTRELIPSDMLADVARAKIVITNYHAFKLRERIQLAKGTRRLLEGRSGEEVMTLETEGQMIQRVMPELMGMKNILAINDEGHHCYRQREGASEETVDKEDEEESKQNQEAAHMWISGLETVRRKLGISQVFDLSATPFFLRGSGYAEGTLFPWTVSDFSLMDAIESGIVKLPRIPVADNITGQDVPTFRELWKHVRGELPRTGVRKSKAHDPERLPAKLETALRALYGHYVNTYRAWDEAEIGVPPCFIVVCQNTAISKLVYDFVSGFHRKTEDRETFVPGALPLFRNFTDNAQPLARPRTLLIDSAQLEAGDALDSKFREMAADEIERFRREIVQRTGDQQAAENLTDQDLLREVMNTVGKPGQLGADVRCVVSVSMLTEGWDANTVTHVLGVRAFQTQLLCEQVVGRALRRQSYDLNEEGRFGVEYADVLGVPFHFTAKPVVVKPKPPARTVEVKAVRPDRDHLEIQFPRIEGYGVELPEERLEAKFSPDSTLELTPELVGPTRVKLSGIVGEAHNIDLDHLEGVRDSTIAFNLTKHVLYTKLRDGEEEPKLHLFGDLKRIVTEWVAHHLVTKGNTPKATILYRELADMAASLIAHAITSRFLGEKPITARSDPYNPVGSTRHVFFTTSRHRWDTSGPPPKNHVNYVILDSGWEGEFCRVVEDHPQVMAYTKNHGLNFEVPYLFGSHKRTYLPDFIVLLDDGHGKDDPLHVVVEIKGYRREDAKEKKRTMETRWIPGVNALGTFGRWAFAEFTDGQEIESAFAAFVDSVAGTAAGGR